MLKEAKELLGVTTRTIQRWDNDGKIRVVRTIGGRRRIPESKECSIIPMMGYKADVKILNPYNSTKRCYRCGMTNAPKGAIYEYKCGLRIDRQLNASINLYLKMEGLTPSPRLFDELMNAWRGLTLTGEEADESQELCMFIKDYIAQNPTDIQLIQKARGRDGPLTFGSRVLG